MTTVGAYEAKTHLPALLAKVEAGETVTITRHGHPVARLVPAMDSHERQLDVVFADIRGITLDLGDLSIREAIEFERR